MGRFDRQPFAKRALGHVAPPVEDPIEAAKRTEALKKAAEKRLKKAAKRVFGGR